MSLKLYSAAFILTLALVTASSQADIIEVEVRDFAFAPDPVVIHSGDTVRWKWVGAIAHTSSAAVGFTEFWHSGLLGNGATFDYFFSEAGTFPYHCHPHGQDNGDGTVSGMSSIVIVESAKGMTMNGLAPVNAGAGSTMYVNGATPGNNIFFVYSFKTGSPNLPGCSGIQLGIAKPKIAGTSKANIYGVAQLTVNIPTSAAGLSVKTQAVDLGACAVSNVVTQKIN